ncbi:Myosin motor domain-containing protein [Plasmodiophora brassicae]
MESFWYRGHLYSSPMDNFHAALFWAYHYRTTFRPADMELPPKPRNTGDMGGWQASCHRFFKAAEDNVVNSISEVRGNSEAGRRRLRPVCRHASRLRRLMRNLGLVGSHIPKPFAGEYERTTFSADIADTIPWPSMSEVKPVPTLPLTMSSAWAATIAYTRSLDDRTRWDWKVLTRTRENNIYDALFWAHQYSTAWKPPGMSPPPKPATSDGFGEWQASCYRFFKTAEDILVKTIVTVQGGADDVDDGSAGIRRLSNSLRCHVMNVGLAIDPDVHKPYKRTPEVVNPQHKRSKRGRR